MQLAIEGPRVPDVRDAEVEELSAFLETAYRLCLAKPRRGLWTPSYWNWLRFERTCVNIMPFVFFKAKFHWDQFLVTSS